MQEAHWFCVIWLSIQAAFLLIFSWVLPIGLIPLLGLSLILWPHAAKSAEKTPINLRVLWRLPALALLIAGSLFYLWHYNPLPTDEEMIQNFHDHRSEFEQLAHEYRNYRQSLEPNAPSYTQSEHAKSLMKASKVCCLRMGGGRWLPDPYSARAAKFSWGLSSRSADPHIRPPLDGPDQWRQALPELFEGVPPITNLTHINHQTGIMRLDYGYPRAIDRFGWRYGAGISKAYFHYPQPPKVQDGRLLTPYYTITGKPITRPGERVLESLNDYPPNWKKGECVLRRIDPNWFLAFC